MASYRLYTYDLCGNDEDGFEINDYHYQGAIEIPERVLNSETLSGGENELFQYLKRAELPIRRYTSFKYWEIEWSETILYFTYKGIPQFEIRKVDN